MSTACTLSERNPGAPLIDAGAEWSPEHGRGHLLLWADEDALESASRAKNKNKGGKKEESGGAARGTAVVSCRCIRRSRASGPRRRRLRRIPTSTSGGRLNARGERSRPEEEGRRSF
ncbi:hypothetical protein MTO96_009991 [Rhipicephalus appendiculatus]